MPHAESEGVPGQIASEARIVGLRETRLPSLETIDRRRLQLWMLSTILLVCASVAVAVTSMWPWRPGPRIPSGALRWGVVLLSLGFCAYAIDKERHLQRLAKLLTDERVLTAALSNRLRELSLLLQAGKAMNSALEIDAVLDVILRSALDLLAGTSGSVMLADGDELVASCVRNNPEAIGRRVPLGEGIAGRVALTREPLLINGRPSPREFPGLRPRERAVASAMSVPLMHRDQFLGVLNVNADADRTFTEYELRALSLFAEQAAIAIANARLFDAERAHVVELVELDQMKSEFLKLVTHELRTPLTVILAAVKTGMQPEPPVAVPELLAIIERNGKHLATMVEELLIAARIEQGGSPYTCDMGLADAIRDVARDFAVTERPVEVEIRDELTTTGDPDALRRILINLLDNAHKYGAPPVRVTLERIDDRAVVSVLDAGPGLPPEHRDRLFERFYRVADQDQPGIGLGLAIVRGLAAAWGGHVWAEDLPEGGTAFRVALPITAVQLEAV